jgi:hypothetical protein
VSPHCCRLYVIKVLRIKVAKLVISLLEARVNRAICRLCIPSTQARLLSTFLWDVKSSFGYLCLLSMLKGNAVCHESCICYAEHFRVIWGGQFGTAVKLWGEHTSLKDQTILAVFTSVQSRLL